MFSGYSLSRAGALGLLLSVLIFRSIESIGWLFYVVFYPFGIDYGEGIVLQQALLFPGPEAYGDITRYPFIVFHYPPVYLLSVRSLVHLGLDPLLAGRATSVLATCSMVGLVGYGSWVLSQGLNSRARCLGALVAAMVLLTSPIVSAWGALARVDMLAVALSLGAVLLAAHSAGSNPRLYFAVLLSVLAFYTKQTSIAAPVAIVLGLLICRPRDAVRAVIAGVLMGLAGFATFMAMTDGGFFRHVVLYNINRFSLDLLLERLRAFVLYVGGVQALLAVLAGALVVPGMLGKSWGTASGRLRTGATPQLRLAVMVCVALGVSTPMLLLMGKSGSMLNYAIEWLCYATLLVGTLIAHLASPGPSRGEFQAGNAGQITAVAAPVLLAAFVFANSRAIWADTTAHRQERTTLLAEIRATPKPVLSDDMVLLLQAGKRVVWEAAIFAELASTGRWDEGLIIDLIRAKAFALIITEGSRDWDLFRARYTPAVLAAIDEAYPRQEQLTYVIVHRPID